MNKIYGISMVLLLLLTLLTVVGSWLLAAWGIPVSGILQPEGIRWLFANFPDLFGGSYIPLLLLLFCTIGSVRHTEFLRDFTTLLRRKQLTYRKLFALRCSLVCWPLLLAPYLLLAFTPHSLLLSLEGTLGMDSPLVCSFPYILLLTLLLTSLFHGMLSGKLSTLGEGVSSLTVGIARYAPILILYLQLYFLTSLLEYVLTSH